MRSVAEHRRVPSRASPARRGGREYTQAGGYEMIVYPEAAAVAAGGEHADTYGVRRQPDRQTSQSDFMRPKRILACVP